MKEKIRRGFWKHLLPLPGSLLEKGADRARKAIKTELAFMTEEHRRVHHFVVGQLPAVCEPMAPVLIAEGVDLPVERVVTILDELEERMTFLFRNREGSVVWAYPVTVEATPHHLTFSTGELIYAA
ncbi:MAG: hypothetical protein JSV26_10510 [bacterium]|nr:MAG: hypothetical protein JSV26_10510 [bacterium]